MAAWRQLSDSGSGTTQSAGTRGVGGRSRRGGPRRGRSPGPGPAVPGLKSADPLSSTVPVSSTPGTRGNWRATRLPGRVTIASLKLMADHSTRINTSPGGRSSSVSCDDGGADHLPRLRQHVGREAHRITVEAHGGGPRFGCRCGVRSHDGAHDPRLWALDLALDRGGGGGRQGVLGRALLGRHGAVLARVTPGGKRACGVRAGRRRRPHRPFARGRQHPEPGARVRRRRGLSRARPGPGHLRLRGPVGPARLALRRPGRRLMPSRRPPPMGRSTATAASRPRRTATGCWPSARPSRLRPTGPHGAASSRCPPDRGAPVESTLLDGQAGHDFFGAPRVDQSSARLAVVTWDHPDMPWDASRLVVLPLRRGQGARSDGTAPVLEPAGEPWHRGRRRRRVRRTAGVAARRLVPLRLGSTRLVAALRPSGFA